MLNQVREYMKQKDMLRPGDRVIAAVSGGADSVCLLSVLQALAPELSVSLRVLHVHHGLRGAEADRDEACVRNLCEAYELPFESVHCDVMAYAGERGLSTEEAGRILRYEALERAAQDWDREQPTSAPEAGKEGQQARPAWIAVAHHQEDQAETILHHLLRGSGLRGLSGMRPVQGRRIRPLLTVSREEIRDYLRSRNLSWCEDSTNQLPDYTRNRIRTRLLPQMKETVNVRAVENILHAGEIFAEADDYLAAQAEKLWNEAGRVWKRDREQGAAIALEVFCSQPSIIQTYLCRRMLELTAPGQKDITAKHYVQLRELAVKPVGSRADLPGGLYAETGYDELRIVHSGRSEENPAGQCGCEKQQKNPGSDKEDPKDHFTIRHFPRQNGEEIPKNQYTKWFDYDKIKGTLSARGRQAGDYITLADGRHKTIRRLLIDEKIPRQERDSLLLLAEGNHVLWVVGCRISEYYKITNDTTTILQVTFNGGENHGR